MAGGVFAVANLPGATHADAGGADEVTLSPATGTANFLGSRNQSSRNSPMSLRHKVHMLMVL